MKNLFALSLGILFLSLVSCGDAGKKSNEPWVDLFNGKDFSGWVQLGGDASYDIADGAIVGTSTLNTPNSFLCTQEHYGDFILELEFKVDPSLNSGVQIRSHSIPEYQKGRVHGYQVEIDPAPRAWTGGLYDEARRGWLYALSQPENEEARKAFKNNQWNKIRVEAIGSHMKTWINDIPVANLHDDETDKGFIALQVHSIRDSSQAGTQVMWRDIRIITDNPQRFTTETTAPEISYLTNKLTEKEIAEGWKLLFDGKTSNGWRRVYQDVFPEKGWKIENGLLRVEESGGGESTHGGDIVTVDEYSSFELVLQARLTPGANSGVKYFVTEAEKVTGSAIGPEYQIIDDSRPGLNETQKIGALYDLIPAQNIRVNAVGQWNTIRIVVKGKHVEHWLNGFKVVEYERGSDEFRKLVSQSKFKVYPGYGEAESGHILLQDHGGEVAFKGIKIRSERQ